MLAYSTLRCQVPLSAVEVPVRTPRRPTAPARTSAAMPASTTRRPHAAVRSWAPVSSPTMVVPGRLTRSPAPDDLVLGEARSATTHVLDDIVPARCADARGDETGQVVGGDEPGESVWRPGEPEPFGAVLG